LAPTPPPQEEIAHVGRTLLSAAFDFDFDLDFDVDLDFDPAAVRPTHHLSFRPRPKRQRRQSGGTCCSLAASGGWAVLPRPILLIERLPDQGFDHCLPADIQ